MVDTERRGAVEDLVADSLAREGSVLFTITSASMLPAIRPGDQVEVRRVEPGRARLGDMVLFRDARLGHLVHRVLGRWPPAGRASRIYTKGDASWRGDPLLEGAAVLGRVERILRDGAEVEPRRGARALALRSWLALAWHRARDLVGRSRETREGEREVDPVRREP